MNDVALLQWSDNYLVGDKIADWEHKYLFSLIQEFINDLADALGSGEINRGAINDSLKVILDYTETHFRDEELFMRTFSYERYQEHCDSHRNMVHQIEKLQNHIKSDKPIAISAIIHCLKKWLLGHILEEDMKLAQLVAEVKTKKTLRL